MTLTGAVVVDHFHHEHDSVLSIIGAHFLGMYALVIVVGGLIDRIGRAQSLSGGLLLMGLSVSSLLSLASAHATAAALVGLGLGWKLLVRRRHDAASPPRPLHDRLPQEDAMHPHLTMILADLRVAR